MNTSPVRTIATLCAATLSLAAGAARAQAFYLDRFAVTASSWPSFVDTFNNGKLPPSGPLDVSLGPSNTYTVAGTLPAGSESLGKLAIDPRVYGAPSFNGGVTVAAVVNKTLSSDAAFTISSLFDVPTAPGPWLIGSLAYEYVNGPLGPIATGNIIYALLGNDGTTFFEAAAEANYFAGTFFLLTAVAVTAPTGDEIRLTLTDTGLGTINAAYQVYANGLGVGTSSTFYSYPTATPLYEPAFAVGTMLPTVVAVPEPSLEALLLAGSCLVGLALRRRTSPTS